MNIKDLISKEVTKILKEQFRQASPPKGPTDEARELELYITNDGELYKQAQAIMANLRKKIKKGNYNPERAVDLWMYLATAGAKKYMKEFGSPNGRIQDIFPKPVRYEAAQLIADAYEEELQGGLTEQLEKKECDCVNEAKCSCGDKQVNEQRFEGDKRQSDEDPMADFDTSELYDDEDEDPYDAFEGMDVMGPEGTETFDKSKHLPKATNPTPEELKLLDRRAQWEWDQEEEYQREYGGESRLDWELD